MKKKQSEQTTIHKGPGDITFHRHKIYFKDLSGWLKFAVITAIIYGGLAVVGIILSLIESALGIA